MASFYAELHVAGHVYPARHCTYHFTQATDHRGRVIAKVRHGQVELELDVPADDFLLAWASIAYQSLAGHVAFFAAKGGAARESVAWETGHCVGYREEFAAGNATDGAYVCFVTIAAPKLTLHAGVPTAYVPPAARDHGVPPVAAAAPLAAATKLAKAANLTKQQRYDARMSLLANARGKLAQSPPPDGPLTAVRDATRVAPSAAADRLTKERTGAQYAVDRLTRDNVAVERARLSEHVYHTMGKLPVPAPEGWHMLNPQELARKGITPDMLFNIVIIA